MADKFNRASWERLYPVVMSPERTAEVGNPQNPKKLHVPTSPTKPMNLKALRRCRINKSNGKETRPTWYPLTAIK
jgi:hypothetical protein